MSTSGYFHNYEYEDGPNNGNLAVPAGEQGEETFAGEGQGCEPCVRSVTHEVSGNHVQDITYIVTLVMFKMAGDSDVPWNIGLHEEAEGVTPNDSSLLDVNGQEPHSLPRDEDMPTLIYTD